MYANFMQFKGLEFESNVSKMYFYLLVSFQNKRHVTLNNKG